MKTLLLTAFEPFDNEEVNPSWEVIRLWEGKQTGDIQIKTVCLPCVFELSLQVLQQALDTYSPEMVISFGQAGGRSDITPEFIAINLNDARICDNAGKQPISERIIADAPAAYFTTLPVKTMVHNLTLAGIPASLSYTAGTFVCNHVFYGLQHFCQQYGILKSGFIHLPYLPKQAAHHRGQPSMALTTLNEAVHIIIQTSLQTQQDILAVTGKTH